MFASALAFSKAPGVAARAALAVALLLLAAVVAALGALARRVLPPADVAAVVTKVPDGFTPHAGRTQLAAACRHAPGAL